MAKLKLHYLPGACSLAAHIALREAGLDFDLDKMDRSTPVKKTQAGEDYLQVNPKGQVPVLRVDGKETLTECAVILQYIADQKPVSGLAPAQGTMERYHEQEWLNWVASDLHKIFGPLFRPTTPEAYVAITMDLLAQRYKFLDGHLANKSYLMGDKFTVADAYCFTIMNWARTKKLDLSPYPHLKAYVERVAARPKVQEAMQAEGLIQ